MNVSFLKLVDFDYLLTQKKADRTAFHRFHFLSVKSVRIGVKQRLIHPKVNQNIRFRSNKN
jgi:hypothetical protein